MRSRSVYRGSGGFLFLAVVMVLAIACSAIFRAVGIMVGEALAWLIASIDLILTVAICVPAVAYAATSPNAARWMVRQWHLRDTPPEPLESQAYRLAGMALLGPVPLELAPSREAAVLAVRRGWVRRRGNILFSQHAKERR